MESTNDHTEIEMNSDKSVSALEHNIKTKKENAYYYAHAYKFDKKDSDSEAKTISGPGIITGGDPVHLGKSTKPVEVIKEPKKFTKYIFYDDDKFAVVKIDLPDDIKDLITEECIELNFTERSLDLKVNVPNGDPYFFSVKKLFEKILSNESKMKLAKGKLIINIRKKNEDEEWTKLSA
jgi:hypothetical protein